MEAVNEIRLLASVRHPNVVNYHEAFIDGNRLCIIMEYASHGDLSRCISKRRQARKPFSEETIWSYFIQICFGVQALHNQRVLHRDIKAANILRSGAHVVKVGDLGIAKLMKSNMTKTQIGTPHYMPPEVWRNKPYSFPSDVWALGCLMYEMATGTVPFEARSIKELRHRVLRGKYPAIPRSYSSDLHNMVHSMLTMDASKRPTIGEILQSPAVVKRFCVLPDSLNERNADTSCSSASSMLNTIKVPRNIKLLRKNLPAPWYPEEADTRASWPRADGKTKLPPISKSVESAPPSKSSPGRLHGRHPRSGERRKVSPPKRDLDVSRMDSRISRMAPKPSLYDPSQKRPSELHRPLKRLMKDMPKVYRSDESGLKRRDGDKWRKYHHPGEIRKQAAMPVISERPKQKPKAPVFDKNVPRCAQVGAAYHNRRYG